MAACIRIGIGRAKTSDVWNYFKYDAVNNENKCMIEGSGELCKAKPIPKKKNPTYLKTFRNATRSDIQKNDKEKGRESSD